MNFFFYASVNEPNSPLSYLFSMTFIPSKSHLITIQFCYIYRLNNLNEM